MQGVHLNKKKVFTHTPDDNLVSFVLLMMLLLHSGGKWIGFAIEHTQDFCKSQVLNVICVYWVVYMKLIVYYIQ